jgi:hypothetical protein
MSKEHTSLPMQSLSVDEKHDPINGHASLRSPGAQGNGASGHSAAAGILPGGSMSKKPERKVHPAFIIVIWISVSMSVIIYNA